MKTKELKKSDISLSNISISKDGIREEIMNFEDQLRGQPDAIHGDSSLCPLKHTFSDGIYVREIFIPAGLFIVGKIHKHEHPNFLMSGVVEVVTEKGREMLIGPCSIISPSGTKRALYSVTDLTWITVHLNPTNTRDLAVIEKDVIAESYEIYERFKAVSSNKVVRLWNKMVKKLTI